MTLLRAALKPCSAPCCPVLVAKGRCEAHTKRRWQAQDERRGTAHARGYDAQWRKLRLWFLQRNPLCADCRKHGYVTAAYEVHHIVPIAQAPERRLDPDNLASLCKPCHSRISLRDSVARAGSW